jgi:hypothetical protein
MKGVRIARTQLCKTLSFFDPINSKEKKVDMSM